MTPVLTHQWLGDLCSCHRFRADQLHQKLIVEEIGLLPATDILNSPRMKMCMLWLQGAEPEARTFNTIIIACNLCGQPLQALEVCCSAHSL